MDPANDIVFFDKVAVWRIIINEICALDDLLRCIAPRIENDNVSLIISFSSIDIFEKATDHKDFRGADWADGQIIATDVMVFYKLPLCPFFCDI